MTVTKPTSGNSVGIPRTVNVQDFGAVGDGITDETTAFTSAAATINATGANRGQKLWIPHGRYYLPTGVPVTNSNIVFEGEGSNAGWPIVNGVGCTELLVGSGAIGLNFNPSANTLSGPRVRHLSIAPLYGKLAASQTISNGGTVACQPGATAASIASFPASGTATIQDRSHRGRFSYTSHDATTFSGITVLSETTGSATYAISSMVSLDAQGGIYMKNMNQHIFEDVNIFGFNDSARSSYGMFIDGTSAHLQYGIVRDCWISGCYTGAKEINAATRWSFCNFDSSFNGGGFVSGTACYLGTTSKEVQFVGCNFVGADTLIDYDGITQSSSTGWGIAFCRFEGWGTYAVRLRNTQGGSIVGGSWSNSINSNAGTGIQLESTTANCRVFPNRIYSVTTRISDLGTNNVTDDLGILKTAGVATLTVAGTPSDASFQVAPPIGTLAVDTTNMMIYARVGANVWKGVTIA